MPFRNSGTTVHTLHKSYRIFGKCGYTLATWNTILIKTIHLSVNEKLN